MHRIVGIDLGRITSAAHYIEGFGEGKTIKLIQKDFGQMLWTPEHMLKILDGMKDIVHLAVHVGFENVPFAGSSGQAATFATYRSLMLLAAYPGVNIQGMGMNGKPTPGIAPNSLKKWCCGSGMAVKNDMMVYAKNFLAVCEQSGCTIDRGEVHFGEDNYDMADAICVLAWATTQRGLEAQL